MSLNIGMPEITELKPRILVIGVGGAGGNAVNNMITSSLAGVEFVVANTDAQALANSMCDHRIQLGTQITQGLGAGARPDIGAASAQEAIDLLKEPLAGAHMAFITAGMGGGTGTGAAPVIAKLAREQGILTVGVVTKPFQFEGSRRMTIADEGVEELQKHVDTLIIIPNQNLFRIANEKTTFADAFAMADNVLHSGVRGITDLMVMPGLINLDFADVRTVMMEMGKAMMGTGEASGENRSIEAAEAAISNPLLDDVSMKGARGVLINITGGQDLTLFEVDEAANRIRSEVDPDANIIVGSTFNDSLEGGIRVSVFATGIEAEPGRVASPATVMPFVARPVAVEQAPASAEPAVAEQVSVPETLEEPAPVVPLAEGAEPAAASAPELVADPEPVEEEAALLTLDMDDALPADGAMAAPASAAAATGTIDEEAPFIAPQPMRIDDTAEMDLPLERPDPFAEAAVTNGATEARPAKGPSLFERMTGRTRKTEAAPAAEPAKVEPVIESVKRTPEPPVEPVPAPVQVDDQGRAPLTLKNAGGAERNDALDPPEDQIDIPAFLRRQAN